MVPRRLQIGRDPQPHRRNSLKSHSEAGGEKNTKFDAPVAAKLHHSHQTWSVCRMHTRRRRALPFTVEAPLLPQQIRWSASLLTAESENVRKWTQERKRGGKDRWRDQSQKSGRKRGLSQPAFITRDCIRRRNHTGCADNSPFHFSSFRRARFTLEPTD